MLNTNKDVNFDSVQIVLLEVLGASESEIGVEIAVHPEVIVLVELLVYVQRFLRYVHPRTPRCCDNKIDKITSYSFIFNPNFIVFFWCFSS